ncbi:MAG: hypothetical protein M0Z30_21070 [Actinomycetota bacterium]|nr:hypothetical protein [Actinomycetota bacterium]
MTAAIALAVVLVIAVAGASMALESQKTGQPPGSRPSRPVRPPRPADREPPRRPLRRRERVKPVDPTSADAPLPPPPPVPEPEVKGPDLRRTGTPAQAKVVSVVDERTIGPVTRSRLVLRVEPAGADPMEVTVRHAFPTPDSRASVKVGGTVPVRYDPADPRRVVIDLPQG